MESLVSQLANVTALKVKMKKLPSFQYIHNSQSVILDIILHGGSKGIDSPFIQKLITASKNKGDSVLAFNFPYLDRGEENSSGPKLKEELAALKEVMNFCQASRFSHIRFIAKSLGAIVASYFLKSLEEKEHHRYSIVVLGYIAGSIDLKGFNGKIAIIQGEKDRFGDINTVKKDMASSVSKDILYFEIKGADHSYRIPETKEPVYEDKVVRLLKNL